VVLLFPASYLMDRVGLRWSFLVGAAGTTIGAWIKVFAVSPDSFVLLFFGHTIVAASNILVVNGPPRLAAAWFGSKEVATATAIGCFGSMGGVSVLFLVTPMVVRNHESIEEIGNDLANFLLAIAVVCTVVAVALFLFFKDKPPIPPSEAQAHRKTFNSVKSLAFLAVLKRVLTNKTFIAIWIMYGIHLGFFVTISTMLNPLYLAHFKNGEADAGRLGFLFTFLGNIGSIVFGMVLDKTKKFKVHSIVIYALTLIGEILFALGLMMEIKWLVFPAIIVIGISTSSYGALGFELSAEATYPEPEELPSAFLNMASVVFGMPMALIIGSLLRTYGDKAAHLCLVCILIPGLVLSMFTKNELKRQNAKGDVQNEYNVVALSEIIEPDHR